VIAAQSIGEPGTQLTMRTFHTGGIAGEDITHGLPRVVELFEARTPKGAAVLARTSGVIRIVEEDNARRVTVVSDDGSEEVHNVSLRAKLADGVHEGAEIAAGDAIVDGPKDPKQLLEIKGIRETQQYLVNEVQQVYRDQGVSIHDKHIELIVRQMLRRVLVAEQGESPFLPGERVDARAFSEANRQLVTEGKRPAEGRPELMGITKASLATDSWLSAASFQETTRVLTEAAIEGRSDQLFGLKENIIIGKLIPAGTGMTRYRELELDAPEAERMTFWSSADDEAGTEDLAAWLASIGTSTAVSSAPSAEGSFEGDGFGDSGQESAS
jgi:DNA-directed RNA polymerase subunit beta'